MIKIKILGKFLIKLKEKSQLAFALCFFYLLVLLALNYHINDGRIIIEGKNIFFYFCYSLTPIMVVAGICVHDLINEED